MAVLQNIVLSKLFWLNFVYSKKKSDWKGIAHWELINKSNTIDDIIAPVLSMWSFHSCIRRALSSSLRSTSSLVHFGSIAGLSVEAPPADAPPRHKSRIKCMFTRFRHHSRWANNFYTLRIGVAIQTHGWLIMRSWVGKKRSRRPISSRRPFHHLALV